MAFDAATPAVSTAITTALAVLSGVLGWLTYKNRTPKPDPRWAWNRFPVTTPPLAAEHQNDAKENAARWYHRIIVRNQGGRSATKVRIAIKAPSPILARRITPESGQDALIPIPETQNSDPSDLKLETERIGPGDNVLIELWTISGERPRVEIKLDERIVQISKIEDKDLPSRPSPISISLLVALGTAALAVAFYFIAQKF